MNLLFKSIINNPRYLFFFFLFSITSGLQGQNLINVPTDGGLDNLNQKPYKTISFGEKISWGKIDHPIVWTISSLETNDKVVINGDEINTYKFEIPGAYQITFQENNPTLENECNHLSFPKLMIIKVSPIKMEFDFSTIKINKTLEAGANLEGSELSLIVNLKSYTNDSVVFSKGKIASAGIGTTINGQLLNEVTLKPGSNKVTYKLNGSASKDTYIMLDFFDINEQVQSYYYPTKL